MENSTHIRLAMAQINVIVGDVEGNTDKIGHWIDQARHAGADIVTFPELAITGYPPEDLLLKPQFIDANLAGLQRVVGHSRDIVVIVGFVDRHDDIFNAAAIAQNGKLMTTYHKIYLPNYGVFDEFRYFQPGARCPVFQMSDATVGVSICEDIWYPDGPVFQQALAGGAELIINISSSPYHAGKRRWRERMLATRASDNIVIVAYNNLVGGQDELVFDGDSLVFNENGDVVARGKQFEEELIVVDLDIESVFRKRLHDPRRRQQDTAASAPRDVFSLGLREGARAPLAHTPRHHPLDDDAEIYKALVLGTRDYVAKNGFKRVVLGLSGGIDSALTATIAVDALGKENVVGVLMPSEFSSRGSVADSEQLARNLGIEIITIPINDVFESYKAALKEAFKSVKPDVTEENLQARIRGTYLMALSNKFGWLVLSTGNKSEISSGYCTLYGDMAGGFAVLKDVMKTTVYRLAEYCNRAAGRERIPRAVIEKQPSAELRPDQLDTDSLPPYEVLDPILKAYVEEDRGFAEMVEMGFDEALVRRVIRMVDFNEYKRRQAAPGVKITPRAFGRDRRMPITNQFK
ncbi:MAG: NAD+ synthase [Acidobacteria bacterium]|nr:NAD+ synthase [Acidobacteriota bacterium]